MAGNGGKDTLIGNDGSDTYLVDSTNDLVIETNSLSGGGIDLVQASVSYTLGTTSYVERLELIGSAVFAVGNSIDNTLVGNSLSNSLDGGSGDDSLFGGEGNDTYVVDSTSDIVRETDADSLVGGIDLVRSGVNFTLGANFERLELTGNTAVSGTGNSLANTLTGNLIDNSLDGGTGVDSLLGGAGNDTYFVDNAADVVFENTGEGTDLVVSSVSYTLGAQVDQLILTGTAVSATGNNIANTLTGNAIANSLDGGAGIDSLVGGAGNDTYFVDDSSDKIYEVSSQGIDLVLVSANAYTLSGEVENLTYTGTGNATFVGNSLANVIDARAAGTNSLAGGDGNDTLILDASLRGSVDGGANDDTLRFVGTAGMTLGDNAFTGFTSIESYDFSGVSGNIDISIGTNAQGKGIATLSGGTANSTLTAETSYGANAIYFTAGSGNDSLTGNSGNDTLVAGSGRAKLSGNAGNDSFLFSSSAQLANNTVVGGADTDTLVLTATSTITDAQLVNVSVVEAIQASSLTGNSITLGTNALASGVTTLKGGAAGGDTLSAAGYTTSNAKITIDATGSTLGSTLVAGLGDPAFTGGNTLLGGSGADLIQVATATVLSNASIVGGNGTDTVQVTTDAQVLGDTDLDSLLGIEALQLANGANSITLGDKARGIATVAAGLDIITTGSGSDTLTATSAFDITAITLDGGAGNDRFVFDTAAQMAAASLIGGAGTDTLALGQATVLGNDDAFQKVTGMEVLQAAASGESSFVLAAKAQAAGIRTVIGGSGKGILNASAYIVDVTLDASANSNTTAGQGATLLGGSANDAFRLLNNNVLSVSSIVGNEGSDTLSFSQDGLSITDDKFGANITGVEVVQTRNGTNYVNLGANAATAGLQTLIGGTGADTFDASAFTASITIDSGDGAELITGSATNANCILSGAGNDSITLATATAINRSTVTGGLGTDTLALSGNDTLTDANLANVSGVEILRAAASGTSSLTVGANAQTGGIRTVIGGDANDTLHAGAFTTGMTLGGGAGDDSLVVSTGAVLGQSSILGGSGTDTLSFSIDALSVTDADFAGVTSVEALKTANGNNRVILGAEAQAAGIATVVGGTGIDTLSAAGYTAASGVVFLNADATDSLVGGAGVDTISSGSNFNMSLSSGVEVLELTGSATLGTGNSQDNWLLGGSGNDSLSGLDGNDTLEGRAGTDSLVGGLGDDVYIVEDSADAIVENSGAGTDTVRSSANYTLSGNNVENLVYTSTLGGGLTGNSLNNSLIGNIGNDTLEGKDSVAGGTDTLIGGAGDDRYVVDSATDLIIDASGVDMVESKTDFDLSNTLVGGGNTIENLAYTGSGAATLTGNSLNNSLFGNSGNDTLEGQGGVDTLSGGAGLDVYIVDTTTDLIEDNGGATDMVRSSVSFDLSNTLVAGGSGIEQLVLTGAAVSGTGNIVANTLTGNSLANSLDGGADIDSLIGGLGSDTYFVDNALDKVSETDATTLGGNDLVVSSIDYTLLSNVERLVLTGSATLGAGNGLDNTLTGNSLANSLVGGAGVDSLIGGLGDDTYRVDTLGDTVFENANEGTDTVISMVSHTLSGNIENLTYEGTLSATLTGNALANTILGNALGNRLDGAVGADSLVGGAGNDTYVVDNAGDVLVEGAGTDTDLVESSINYTLGGNFEQLVLTGTAVSGTGNGTGNTLTGNSLGNSLDGGAGADSLIGGLGSDTYFVDEAGDNISETDSNSLTGGVDTVFSTVAHTLAANVENLTYTGAANASLSGNAGDNLIDGSGAGTNTLIGGAGNDTFVVNADRLGTVVEDAGAGNGTDTIRLVGASATLNNAAFNNIEVYDLSRLTAQATVTLGSNSTGLVSLVGSAGGDSITASVAVNATLDGGAGADRFAFNDASLVGANASLIGGAGTDTLSFTNTSSLGDSNFAKVSSIEVLEQNGTANAATLGVAAQTAGVRTAITGTGADTLNASAFTVGITLDASRNTGAGATGSTLVGGAAGDRLILSNHNVFNISSLVGGGGTDTLAFGENGIAITDDKFGANLVGVEVLQTKDGTNYIQIGANAKASGLQSLIGGAGADTFDASGFDTLIAIDAGAGADSITLQSTTTVGLSTVIGGAGTDTLSMAQAGTLADADLANVSGIEVLRAASTGASNISIGQKAKAGGLQQVIGGSANDTLDASAFSGAVILTGGEGDDSFVVSTGDNLRSQNVQGGSGTDTLSFAIDQLSVTDADFAGVTSVEVLKTANGNNRVVLGASAQTAGIATVVGGTGNDTFNASSYTIAATLSGGNGNNSLLSGVANDSLTGGNGTDWLQGTSATSAGANQIDTLTGGTGNDTFILGDVTNAYYNTAANGADYALIMDFSTGDMLQLKNLDPAAIGNGYLIGDAAVPSEVLYGALGSSNYYLYRDSNDNGTLESGDNLIAGIQTTGGLALTTANLKSTHGSFV